MSLGRYRRFTPNRERRNDTNAALLAAMKHMVGTRDLAYLPFLSNTYGPGRQARLSHVEGATGFGAGSPGWGILLTVGRFFGGLFRTNPRSHPGGVCRSFDPVDRLTLQASGSNSSERSPVSGHIGTGGDKSWIFQFSVKPL